MIAPCPASFAQKNKPAVVAPAPPAKPVYNLKYELSLSQPHTHLYEVAYTIGNINAGLISHEYFHLWNVKRICPQVLGPFDYQTENYTHNLTVGKQPPDRYTITLNK